MAAQNWYFVASAIGSHGTLSKTDPGANATSGTGWTVGKTAATNYALMIYGTERAAATFGGTALPNAAPSTSDSFVSNVRITGSYASGNFTVSIPVIAVTTGGSQDGRMRVRIWKSANQDGSGAVELTTAVVQTSTLTNLTTSEQTTSSAAVAVSTNLTLTEEYLFIQLAWEVTGAGSANNCDVLIRTGAINVTTTDFTPAAITRTPSDSMDMTDAAARSLTFGRVQALDSIVMTDTLLRHPTLGRNSSDAIVMTDLLTRVCAVNRSPSDALVLTDALLRVCDATRVQALDSIVMTDTLVRLHVLERSNSDAIVMTDAGAGRMCFPVLRAHSLTGCWVAPYPGTAPWIGRSSAGTSGAVNMIASVTSTGLPIAGTAVNGRASCRFEFERAEHYNINMTDSLTYVLS